jgi:hypothetical protein
MEGTCSEIYLEKAFPDSIEPSARFSAAQELSDTGLMFKVRPTLARKDLADT